MQTEGGARGGHQLPHPLLGRLDVPLCPHWQVKEVQLAQASVSPSGKWADDNDSSLIQLLAGWRESKTAPASQGPLEQGWDLTHRSEEGHQEEPQEMAGRAAIFAIGWALGKEPYSSRFFLTPHNTQGGSAINSPCHTTHIPSLINLINI